MPRLTEKDRQQIIELFARAGIAPGVMVRTAQVLPATEGARASDDGEGGFRWVLTTEQPAKVWDWSQNNFVDEVLLADGMILPRQVPLLDSHNRFSVDDHIGSVNNFETGKVGKYAALFGQVRFAADDKGQRTRQKVADGHLTDGSVGYRVTKSIWIPEGTEAAVKGRTFKGPLKVSHEARLMEFSITPIGADTLAKVRHLLGR
jgi:hypothetical protein